MHEVATTLMRSARGWFEHQSLSANLLFQNRDAVMTIFPDGSWECKFHEGFTETERVLRGSVHNLEQFLRDFAEVNS